MPLAGSGVGGGIGSGRLGADGAGGRGRIEGGQCALGAVDGCLAALSAGDAAGSSGDAADRRGPREGTMKAAAQAQRPRIASRAKARAYPAVKAAAAPVAGVLPRRLLVWSMATVARTASPSEPPIWRAVFSTPEARPASV